MAKSHCSVDTDLIGLKKARCYQPINILHLKTFNICLQPTDLFPYETSNWWKQLYAVIVKYSVMLRRLHEFSAFVKYLTVTVQTQLKIFMSAVFEHGEYASLIQYHSLFLTSEPKQAIAGENLSFYLLKRSAFGHPCNSKHLTENVCLFKYEGGCCGYHYAYYCSVPKDSSTSIVTKFYAV